MLVVTMTRFGIIAGQERLISDPLHPAFLFCLLVVVCFPSVGLYAERGLRLVY